MGMGAERCEGIHLLLHRTQPGKRREWSFCGAGELLDDGGGGTLRVFCMSAEELKDRLACFTAYSQPSIRLRALNTSEKDPDPTFSISSKSCRYREGLVAINAARTNTTPRMSAWSNVHHVKRTYVDGQGKDMGSAQG